MFEFTFYIEWDLEAYPATSSYRTLCVDARIPVYETDADGPCFLASKVRTCPLMMDPSIMSWMTRCPYGMEGCMTFPSFLEQRCHCVSCQLSLSWKSLNTSSILIYPLHPISAFFTSEESFITRTQSSDDGWWESTTPHQPSSLSHH